MTNTVALLGHFLDLLLAHRAPQQVRPAERVARQHLRRLHHLLLVNHDAVGLAADRLQQRMLVLDLDFPVAAPDEFGNQLHRPRPVQRNQRRDVLDGADLELAAQIAHPAGFQLEHAERVRLVQQVVGLRVVERQVVDRHLDAARLLDHLAGVANDRQRLEAQEIHLQQAQVAHRPHRVLGDDGAVFVLLERQQVHQRLVADDHARGVDRGVARQVFEDERRVDQFARDLLVLVGLLEFRRLLERLFQRHLQIERDHLRQPVALAVAQAHHPAHVAHDRFGAHRAEGDDLRHRLPPVLLPDVFDDIGAAVVGEINVNIRRVDALGIEEALEEQSVADRVRRWRFPAGR